MLPKEKHFDCSPVIDNFSEVGTNLRKIRSFTLELPPFESRIDWESVLGSGSTQSNFDLKLAAVRWCVVLAVLHVFAVLRKSDDHEDRVVLQAQTAQRPLL